MPGQHGVRLVYCGIRHVRRLLARCWLRGRDWDNRRHDPDVELPQLGACLDKPHNRSHVPRWVLLPWHHGRRTRHGICRCDCLPHRLLQCSWLQRVVCLQHCCTRVLHPFSRSGWCRFLTLRGWFLLPGLFFRWGCYQLGDADERWFWIRYGSVRHHFWWRRIQRRCRYSHC